MVRSICAASLMLAAFTGAAPAAAQDTAQSAEDPYTPADPEVSDAEVIRWASREVGREEGRPVEHRPPVPPDRYLAHTPRGEVGAVEGADDGVRVGAEIGGGALGMLIGGGLGTLLVWAALANDAGPVWTMVAGGGATVFAALGVSSGVALAGDATGSRSNFGYAFIGQALGAAAAVPFAVIAVENDVPALALLPIGLLPLAGAVIAYEIAHGVSRAHDGPPVVAYVTPTPGGAIGGVAGRVQ